VNLTERRTLLSAASPRPGEAWGDFGCGAGAFTLPLAEAIGADGTLLAVDRDERALDSLRRALDALPSPLPPVQLRVADVRLPGALPPLDGILLANVLHYLPDAVATLGTLARTLRPGGRVLVIEYDRADATPWVPHPIPVSSLAALAKGAALLPFDVKVRVRSDFGRMLYAAVARAAAPSAPQAPRTVP